MRNTQELINEFYAGRKTNGHCPASIFFEGDTIYSYGYHYPLARIIRNDNQTIVLLNDSGYSNTTAKHINKTSCHSPFPVVRVGGNFEKATAPDLIAYIEKEIAQLELKQKRARKVDYRTAIEQKRWERHLLINTPAELLKGKAVQ